MTDLTVTTQNLSDYLGNPVDDDRATLILTLAQDKCSSILSPLPQEALGVVLDIAARAYVNPTNASSETGGPFSTTYAAVSGGLWLTRANIAELRRLSGGSGAFSIDPTPSDAGPNLLWPQVPLSRDDLPAPPPFDDFDTVPTS